jgi:hypothetical protein
MVEIKEVARNADKLREQANHEHDPAIRDRLNRMADAYGRIASTEAEAAPASIHDLMDALTKRNTG